MEIKIRRKSEENEWTNLGVTFDRIRRIHIPVSSSLGSSFEVVFVVRLLVVFSVVLLLHPVFAAFSDR